MVQSHSCVLWFSVVYGLEKLLIALVKRRKVSSGSLGVSAQEWDCWVISIFNLSFSTIFI